ncbi:MAG: hypothetical protein ACLRSW_07460 [Christensenellaceae bacterium]
MLGAVNPNAVEEYDDENRTTTMITQRDDLQKAIDDLTTALNEIREEMLRQLNEGLRKSTKISRLPS